MLPNWAQCDPGSLDVIEVGTHAAGKSGEALVPYRIEYASDLSSCETTEHATAPKEGTAVVRRAEGGWRVTSLQTRSTTGALLVPSEGGEAIGTAPASAWLAALGISVLLMVLVALLIRLTWLEAIRSWQSCWRPTVMTVAPILMAWLELLPWTTRS